MSKDEKNVSIYQSVAASPERIWHSMLDLSSSTASHPEVLHVITSPEVDGVRLVEWHVFLKGFELQWKEQQLVDASNTTITFVQTEGMFSKYKGYWKVGVPEYGLTPVEGQLEIDLGLPHLGRYVNPVIANAFKAFSGELINTFAQRAFQKDLAAICG